MDRYWDLSETDRASLTDEEYNDLLAVELMERGVLRPKCELLDAPPPEPELEKCSGYVIQYRDRRWGGRSELPIMFERATHAQEFIKLLPNEVYHDSDSGLDVSGPFDEMRVIGKECVSQSAAETHRTVLRDRRRISEANERLLSKYREAERAVDKETEAMRADRARCIASAQRLDRVRETMAEYVKLTNGDHEMARTFLCKVYPVDIVREALNLHEAVVINLPETPATDVAAEDTGF